MNDNIKSQKNTIQNNTSHDERLREEYWFKKLLSRPELGALGGTILVFTFFGIFDISVGGTGMFSALGAINFLEWSAELGIIAVAAALLMIGGEFDLSVGSMIGFAGICIAIPVAIWDWPVWSAIIFAFGCAIIAGYINGILVIKTKLPSFIVTLAMLFILRGFTIALTRLITGRTQIGGLRESMEGDPLGQFFSADVMQWLFNFLARNGLIDTLLDGSPIVTGIPISIILWILITIIATWVLVRTQFGNWIFAVGGDANAARNVGVPVERVKIILFILTAVAATIFACVQVASSGSADTQRGLLKEFEAIIATVIGGTLLTGGYGSAIGAALGALIFGTVQAGIFYTGIDTDWFKVFLGVMMLLAVMFNNFIRKRVTEAK